MAHITGSFAHPQAGTLVVTFSGTFFQNVARDAGFPSTAEGVGNLVLRAYVGPAGAGRRYCEPIDRYAPVSVMEVDYPGGNVSWPVGTEEVVRASPTGSAYWIYGLKNLRIVLVLRKR